MRPLLWHISAVYLHSFENHHVSHSWWTPTNLVSDYISCCYISMYNVRVVSNTTIPDYSKCSLIVEFVWRNNSSKNTGQIYCHAFVRWNERTPSFSKDSVRNKGQLVEMRACFFFSGPETQSSYSKWRGIHFWGPQCLKILLPKFFRNFEELRFLQCGVGWHFWR